MNENDIQSQNPKIANLKATFKRYMFPMLSVWIIAGYIHLMQSLFLQGIFPPAWMPVIFLPIIILEFVLSPGNEQFIQIITKQADVPKPQSQKKKKEKKRVSKQRKVSQANKDTQLSRLWGTIRHTKIKVKIGWGFLWLCRLVFWLIFYAIWVAFVFNEAQNAQWLKWFAPQFYLQFYLVFRAERWFTLIALVLWIGAYYLLTIRWGKLRIFTGVILPSMLAVLLFVHLYYLGGVGRLDEDRITQQPGVELWLDLKSLNSDVVAHPRGICFDAVENALFIMFGCTYCDDNVYYPTVVRQDLATGDVRYFTSSNIRQVECGLASETCSDTLFVAPWYQNVIYELSKQDLSIVKQYPNNVQDQLEYWEPMGILKHGTRLYIGNDVEQALLSYNLETQTVDTILNLVKQGYVQFGGPVWNLVQSQKTGMLYFTSGPGENLYEVDPNSLKIMKHRRFWDITGTALIVDDDRGVLYYQNGGLSNRIYEIDIETFEVIRRFRGEGHARRLFLDTKRNSLYVLGYFSGSVFAIDLESGQRIWTVKVGGLPHGMALNQDTLWVNSMEGVFEVDLPTQWERHAR